jgi:hypothetical protein
MSEEEEAFYNASRPWRRARSFSKPSADDEDDGDDAGSEAKTTYRDLGRAVGAVQGQHWRGQRGTTTSTTASSVSSSRAKCTFVLGCSAARPPATTAQ